MTTRHVPTRTCVGCGARAPQADLLRFGRDGDGLRLDSGRRAAGRGAYLHPVAACWAGFVRRRGEVRSLRWTPGRPERERLVATLSAMEASGAR